MPARRCSLTAGAVLLVCCTSLFIAQTRAFRRYDLSPSERWPKFYDDGWDGIEPVYTSRLKVSWMAPFFSGSGLSSESSLMVLGLDKFMGSDLVIDQHGEKTDFKFVNGVNKRRHKQLVRMSSRSSAAPASTIYVCQSDPDAWSPKPKRLPGNPCPAGGANYKIGRAQTETDSLLMDWPAKLNKMDEVWVPTQHHRDLFVKKGVDPTKLVIVPQPVDLEVFNPAAVTKPLQLPGNYPDSTFRFLSILNWERRKGWDLLLRAYLSAFTRSDNVVLYLLTPEYKSSDELWDFLGNNLDVGSIAALPNIEAVPYVQQRDMPKLYAAVDAFVLPTRGEGWGRTITEAMCMELPVIATDWSGPAAYLTTANSYPVPITELKSVPDGPMAGHRMGEPDLHILRQHMREVVARPDIARSRGKRARVDMQQYSAERVGRFIAHHLCAISDNLDGELTDL